VSNKSSVKIMQGNEACARGAIHAGVRFFGGYPITPSTEIAEVMAKELPRHGGKFIQMEDEIAGMAVIIGASLTGKKVLTATSGPGFSLKQENLGYACITEVPCVVVNVQRGGPSTGLPTSPAQSDLMQAKWGTHGDHPAIVLTPSSVKECFSLTVKAVNLAERFMTPVILLMDEVIGHLREPIDFDEMKDLPIVNRKQPAVPPSEYVSYSAGEDKVPTLAPFGTGYRYHVTGLTHSENGFPTMVPAVVDRMYRRLMDKINDHLDEVLQWESENTEDADVVLVAYGSTARSAKEAMKQLNQEGYKVGIFRPISLWPLPEEELKKIAGRVKALVVPEMNLGQLRIMIDRVACGACEVVGVNKVDGELVTPDEIVQGIKGVLK